MAEQKNETKMIKESKILENKNEVTADRIKTLKVLTSSLENKAKRRGKLSEKLDKIEDKIEDNFKKAVTKIALKVVVQKTGITKEEIENYFEEKDYSKKDLIEEKFIPIVKEKIEDPMERLAVAKALRITWGGDAGHFCCPDDNPRPYVEKMEKLGLSKFVVTDNTHHYVEYKKFKEADKLFFEKYSELISPTVVEEIKASMERIQNRKKKIEENVSSINSILETGKDELEALEKLDSCQNDVDSIRKRIPWVIKFVSSECPSYIKVDIRQNVVAYIKDETHDYGSANSDPEYGVRLTITRGNPANKASKYYKWRDAYSESNDDKRLCFKELEIIKVDQDKVTVKLKNPNREYEETVTLKVAPAEAPGKAIDEKEMKIWREAYKKKKEELLKLHFLPNARMPDYINYTFYSGPSLSTGMSTGKMVPYDQPKIVDEYIDEEQRIGAVIIISQIDHQAGEGKQYRWTGYVIGKDGKEKEVWRENAYEIEMRRGKIIETQAMNLIKLSKN